MNPTESPSYLESLPQRERFIAFLVPFVLGYYLFERGQRTHSLDSISGVMIGTTEGLLPLVALGAGVATESVAIGIGTYLLGRLAIAGVGMINFDH